MIFYPAIANNPQKEPPINKPTIPVKKKALPNSFLPAISVTIAAKILKTKKKIGKKAIRDEQTAKKTMKNSKFTGKTKIVFSIL